MKLYLLRKITICIILFLFVILNFSSNINGFHRKSDNMIDKNLCAENSYMHFFPSNLSKSTIELKNTNNELEIENTKNGNSTYFDWYNIIDFGQTAWGITSVDFNNDSNLDFAVSWATSPWTKSVISIFYNNGEGEFTRDDVYTITKPLYRYIHSLVAGDYDNDSDVDFIFSYTEANESFYATYGVISILFNDGNNNFGNETLIARLGTGKTNDINGRYNPDLTSADFDMDNDLDLIVGDNSGIVEFYTNNGHGNFSSNSVIYDYGICSWGITSEDFDKDGDMDILVAAAPKSFDPEIYGFGQIYLIENQVLPNNQSTCFNHGHGKILANIHNLPGTASLTTLDYEQDGDIDFIAGIGNDLYLYIYENDFFYPCRICTLPNNPEGFSESLTGGGLTSADFNNDGKEEFIAGGVQGVVRFFTLNYSQPTSVFISKPIGRIMYIFDKELKSIFLKRPVVLWKLTVEIKTLGDVPYVQFFVDGSLQFNDTEPPFEWIWNNVSFGRHLLAIKYTAYGNQLWELRNVWKYF